MPVQNWYNFGNKIRGNCKAYPRITDISGKSNSQKFQNWRYICILPAFTARLRNFHKWRTFPMNKSFAWLSTRNQIRSAGHVTAFCGVGNYRSYRENCKEHVRKRIGWVGLETEHLSGHEWSSHFSIIRVCKTFRICQSNGRATTV
jgi:hypothetical protein